MTEISMENKGYAEIDEDENTSVSGIITDVFSSIKSTGVGEYTISLDNRKPLEKDKMKEDYSRKVRTTISYDQEMETDKWRVKIPAISFPSDWQIQIIPPFGGAVVRFRVIKGDAEISIYLDCYDRLGCCGAPYWEIYPYHGDTYRCGIDDIKELLEAITVSIDEQNIKLLPMEKTNE